MIQRHLSIVLTVLFSVLAAGTTQVGNDWRARYGSPVGEIYMIHDGTMLTIFYSGEGKACKVTVEPKTPMLYDEFENLLQEIIPLGDRGKRINSVGLGNNFGGLVAELYERVNISLSTTADGSAIKVESAAIKWKEIECKLPSMGKTK